MSARTRGIFSAVLWTFTLLVFAQHVAGTVRATGVPISGNDFPAFYCAGASVLVHASPYAVEPLRACEHAVPHGSDLPQRYVTPAPLPPYALDLFAALAGAPYAVAAWLWFALLAIACAWLAIALGRLTQIPSGAIACALLLSAGLESVVFGQIPPLVTLAIVLCGTALLRGKDALAALCAVAAMIEPQVGLPVCVALFFFRPATRAWLVSAALLCGAASVFAVSPLGAVHYFTTVLPAQAHAELLAIDQLSLSHVLARSGISDRVALLAGSLSYLLTLALGVAAAGLSSRRLGAAAIAFVPAAAALLAGTYVHEIQLVAALPAAFLCIARGSTWLAWSGRLVVAVVAAAPLTLATEHRPLITVLALFCAAGAILGAIVVRETFEYRALIASIALAAACVAFPVAASRMHSPADSAGVVSSAMPADGSAGDNWGAYLRSDPRYAAIDLGVEVSKIPVWIGLLVLLFATLGTGVPRLGLQAQPAWDFRP